MIFDILKKTASDTNRIVTSEQLYRALSSGTKADSGVSVTPATAMRFGTVFTCVRVRAESVGQLPLHVYEQRGAEKMKALTNPLYALLHDAPNEATTSQEFLEWVSASLDITGNAYIFINRLPSGEIFEFLPLEAAYVEAKRTKAGDPFYVVRVPGTEPRALAGTEVLHIKLMSLDGGLTGASIIMQARNTIALAIAQEKHGSMFFKNGATVGGALQTDQVLNDDTYDALVESWLETQGGLDNAHRTAILEAGVKYTQVGLSLADSQFLEGRSFSQTEIAGLFRVPPHMIGNLEKATFSNIEQQGLDFVVHGLVPTLRRIEQRISLQLIAPADRRRFYAKFSVSGLVRGDMAARGAFYQIMRNIGAMSPNEVRDMEEMNPYPGGDSYDKPLASNTGPGAPKPPEPKPGDKPTKDPNVNGGSDGKPA